MVDLSLFFRYFFAIDFYLILSFCWGIRLRVFFFYGLSQSRVLVCRYKGKICNQFHECGKCTMEKKERNMSVSKSKTGGSKKQQNKKNRDKNVK